MKLLKLFTVLFTVALLSSCSDDDNNQLELKESEYPATIVAYKTAHFPGNDIQRIIKDSEDNSIHYDVYLSGRIELEFDADYKITDIDGVDKLPDSVIPQEILDYVAENYPNRHITDWELEGNYQQIELDNGIELEFNMDGTFIRVDKD